MKKLFTLIAAMLVAFAVNAAVIKINTGTPDALRVALAGASAGDVIEMAAGTYVESNSNFIAFDKSVTVKAADGAVVIVEAKVPVTISNGASAEIIGVKFDGTNLNAVESWYPAVIYASDLSANNRLVLEGCEFYNCAKPVVYGHKDYNYASCSINNCYFHNITNSAIYMAKATGHHACDALHITNSTFANITGHSGAMIEFYNNGETQASDAELVVDHCTFYNITKTENNTYGVIDSRKSTNVIVSNCIFANPASIPDGSYASKATQLYGGSVLKCLRMSNVPAHRNTPAAGNDIVGDPLFVDAANGDFTLGAGSPALGAATDGSNLGDPNWKTGTLYFYNSLGWTDVYANIYRGPYWDDNNGSGNYAGTSVVKANQQMSPVVGANNYYKLDFTGGYYSVVSFTSAAQSNYGNFWSQDGSLKAVYRGDFWNYDVKNTFIPNPMVSVQKNSNAVTYFNEGIWVPYTGNTYTVTYEDLNYKTLCLPFGGTLTGANAYTVTGVDEGAGTVTLSEPTTTLTAGVAYIIKPTALTVSVAFAGEPVTVGTLDYLRGNLNAADWKVDNSWWAYILLDNEFCLISSAATANVPQFKAILKANNTSLAPTLRIIETATNIQNVEGNEAAVKFVKNGQLYIQKDGVTYTAAGIAVK
ncbi:MAG: DUF5123 domain-containing protein [Paludibacteraceae bacterium]|nr:DUF5123 domain-containing protein [Paludibacteraceae bacterium]